MTNQKPSVSGSKEEIISKIDLIMGSSALTTGQVWSVSANIKSLLSHYLDTYAAQQVKEALEGCLREIGEDEKGFSGETNANIYMRNARNDEKQLMRGFIQSKLNNK